jgi:16S rRNA (guanine527-N7)-methyltransferase
MTFGRCIEMDRAELLHRLFADAARPLDPRRHEQFLTYLRELQRWNRTLSLTSITDDASIIRKHFLGALDFLHGFTPSPAFPVLDVGTGAGFPGIPLKLWHPELALDLVESSHRKSAFLQHVCRTLGLGDVRCFVTRVEALGDDSALQGRYAVIVSRGVGGMRRWIPAALRLLQAEGRILLEKGPEALREVRALAPTLAIRGGQIAEMIPLPESSATQRMLVVLTKAG